MGEGCCPGGTSSVILGKLCGMWHSQCGCGSAGRARAAQGSWKSGLGSLEVRGVILEVRLSLINHVQHGFSGNI